ncbi:LacI family DNA-binding transcriptional regulator [Streptomyces sp. 2A115]|uniref:LacI family DNA-binding transcriptional regulator n=1 Tax=Streptomyces sp. 2A115 TaxID=3457439 RepID=UPI003FD4AF4A
MPEQLVDVAERAGVSKATVSKVLNGRQDLSVRPETRRLWRWTRRRVHEAAETLGHRPHSGARAPAGASTHARMGKGGSVISSMTGGGESRR